MKPTVETVKGMFGKKQGYRAKVADCETTVRKTQSEAVAEMESMITTALTGDYTPEIISWRGHVVLVARHPVSGWGTRFIRYGEDDDEIKSGPVGLSGGNCHERRQAVKEAKYHVAQMGWTVGDGVPDLVPDDRRGEFSKWMEFQTRYRQAVDRGMSDNDAYDYAGRNPCRPELWLEVSSPERE